MRNSMTKDTYEVGRVDVEAAGFSAQHLYQAVIA